MQSKNIQVKNILVSDICPSALNPRKTFDQESLAELAQNIKENGLVQPITIRKRPTGSETKYEIVCGERRYRAVCLNGDDTIQCIIKDLDNKHAFAAMIIENLQRKDVDPIEEAAAIAQLWNNGETMLVADIAKLLGKSNSYVIGRIQMSNIIPEFAPLLRNGRVYVVHLIEIGKLTQEQQKALFAECFSEACMSRWKQKYLTIDMLREMIDEHVMQFLDTAKFDIRDGSYSCGHDCEGCPFNTKNKPESFTDANRPRCMKPDCFVNKNLEYILRTAKESKLTPVFQGANNEKWIEAAKVAGLSLVKADDRKYVFMPEEPDKAKFDNAEYYEKRHKAYRHAKAIFDSNIEDGLVEQVYEVCFDGKLSGEYKWAFSAPKEGETVKEALSKQEQIVKCKAELQECNEQEHTELIDEKRKLLAESPYSTINTPLNDEEQKIFNAIIFKRLPYEFKKSLGIEWENSEDAFKKNAAVIEKNSNAIKREFLRSLLSEKSVRYSHDLAGMLVSLLASNISGVEELEAKVAEKYDKKRKTYKDAIEKIKGAKPTENKGETAKSE